MRRIAKIALCLGIVCSSLMGQSPEASNPLDEQSIPKNYLGRIYASKVYKPFTNMIPVYFYCDFDGDNKPDVAIWVTNQKGERGLWIQLGSKHEPIVLGCGLDSSLPWKDLQFEEWTLFRKWQPIDEPYPLRDSPPAPHPKGDYLSLGYKDKGSVVLYWENNTFKAYSGE